MSGERPWPEDPAGDMGPILKASVEAAQPAPVAPQKLTATDRCDGCGAAAAYRIRRAVNGFSRWLHFCGHHFRKHYPKAEADGWAIDGINTDLVDK